MSEAVVRFAEAGKTDAIILTIDGKEIKLSTGDCIQFDRKNEDDTVKKITAKVTHFGFRPMEVSPTRIFYLPWREEGRWATTMLRNTRYIGLNETYMNDYIGDGIWSTITKVICPTELNEVEMTSNSAAATSTSTSGGRRRNRRGSKTARKGRSGHRSGHRSSRSRHTHKH